MKVIRIHVRNEGQTKVFINYCPACKVILSRVNGEASKCSKCGVELDWQWEGRNEVKVHG